MKKSFLLILGLIILVGGFLRVYKISTLPPGLYIDEVSIGLNAYDMLTTGKDQFGIAHPFLFQSLGDWKVPGYIYIVTGSMAVFGKNEFAIRFPSALAGTLTILVIFLLSRELLLLTNTTKKHAESISLLTAGLFAITPWHLHFSRGGFEAIVAMFFYMLGLYLAVLFWQRQKAWQIFLVSILFLGAAYTYDAYRLIVPLTALIGFVLGMRDKEKRKGIGIASSVLFFGMLPLFAFSLTREGQARFMQTSAFSENPYSAGFVKILADIAIFLRNYSSYFSLTYLFRFGDQINRHQVNDLGILYLWQVPCIIAGIYFLTKTKNKTLSAVIAIVLFIGAIPASIARPSPHTLRYLLGSIPYTLLTVLGIYQLFIQKNKYTRALLIGIAIFAVVEAGYYLNYYYVNYPKEALIDWGGACKETARAIQEESTQYQHIVVDKNIGCLGEYFLFYIPTTSITYVDPSWTKPKEWGSTVYVRPFYGKGHPDNLVENITLPNINHDIFAQLLKL